ncbi:hypothetical protein M758_6G054100 [Ceratodon purpureus]|nr:hypothetical protein M758_6G054100 [Ceratodon purpureus]
MRNSQRHFVIPVLLMVLSLVLLVNLVLCRQVPYPSEVESADHHEPTTIARRVMRRLHTVRPAPLGYPPPPTVAVPPTVSPAPSPSV